MTDLAEVRDGSSLPAALAARVREALSMPFLPTVFTLLGEHPRYLQGVVETFLASPPSQVDEHARACRATGAEAAAAIVRTPLALGSATAEVQALIDLYNRVNPPSLLFTLYLATDGTSLPRVMAAPLPSPPPDAGVDGLRGDLRACHGGLNVPGFWRELLAGWPEHARAAWALVRRLAGEERFSAAVTAMRAMTRSALGGRSAPDPLEFGCGPAQAREISKLVALYAIVIPTMTVEIECLRRAAAASVAGGVG